MATAQRQPQFHRRFPAALLVALSLCAGLGARAADTPPSVEPADLASDYAGNAGAPFFLLADSGFSAQETARVRVEGEGGAFVDGAGLDVSVYRVPRPLDFLERQRDLHRVSVPGEAQGEGLANALDYVSDKWIKKSRILWQQIFAARVRAAVVEAVPGLHQASRYAFGPAYEAAPAYRPLKQFELVDRFRYPVAAAQPIAPPENLHLEGSSSNFLETPHQNVYVPLGRLSPGLYFVEAALGRYRATTLVFVSDTLAVTKVSAKGLLVWTANKANGSAASDAEVAWSDGNGVLASGRTDSRGLRLLEHVAPEKSYVFGRDRAGGVFVAENFYYDSEYYGRQFYLFTDRPLYRPGDTVQVKVYGRRFADARNSRAVEAATARLELVDALGQTLLARDLALRPDRGGDASLSLPDNAYLGGYELRLRLDGQVYSGSFRVADYARPPYDIEVRFDRPDYHAGEPVQGHVRLRYPDGAPVRDAALSLSLKAQALSMTDGDARAGTRFPVKLAEQSLHSDKDGDAAFVLPAAAVPSRYMLTLEATQQGTFPVKAHADLLLPAARAAYSLQALPAQDGPVRFRLQGGDAVPAAASWEVVRAEDRERANGAIAAGVSEFAVTFPGPGGYNLFVRDAQGSLLAQTAYTVGDTAAANAAHSGLRLRSDKAGYRPGDTAQIEIAFPEDTDQALLTLERDQVERYAVASQAEDWFVLTRQDARHWRVAVPMTEALSPNVTFSVLVVRAGRYEFQNLGLVLEAPRLALDIASDKPDYRPGETVHVTLTARRDGKPVAGAALAAGVVDEAVYTLQPEIAPTIFDFFYHPRRNSVRTSASLDFFGYDLAWAPAAARSGSFDYRQRVTKIPLRARRETLDTAAWEPDLRTDDAGRAHFAFTMPPSVTRWRISARGMAQDGVVGQAQESITSSQPVRLRWTGPTRFRAGDAPRVGVIAFNATAAAVAATLKLTGVPAKDDQRALTLPPGSTFLDLDLQLERDAVLGLTLSAGAAVYDALDVPLTVDAGGWSAPQSRDLDAGTALSLPADARRLRLRALSSGADVFAAVEGDLIDYPYGCVEQTASRLIPLALALHSLGDDAAGAALHSRLQQRLLTARGRLMALAGPKADFTWWGQATPDASKLLLTAYAYYADWRASRELGIALPAGNAERVVDVYAKNAAAAPLLHRVLALRLMQEMGLPVKTLLQGVAAALVGETVPAGAMTPDESTAVVMDTGAKGTAAASIAAARHDLALLLWRAIARREGASPDAALDAAATAARQRLGAGPPVLAALALALDERPDPGQAAGLLAALGAAQPTLERALALAWLHDALAPTAAARTSLALGAEWVADGAGGWRYRGAAVPDKVDFATTPPPGTRLRLSYESAQNAAADLPAQVHRRLYKLVPAEETGHFAVASASDTLEANALYVDEVTLQSDAPLPYALVEIPLPPGAALEPQRWGFALDGLDDLDASDAADAPLDLEGGEMLSSLRTLSPQRAQVFEDYYAVPVERLQGRLVLRHLLRFGLRGRFGLPPARLYPMYAPNRKALEAPHAPTWTIR